MAVRFWHDQLFAKPARHGGNVAWHQDYSYWRRTVPMNHMTVHLALDEQTEQNGSLLFVPGSHRWRSDGQPLPIPDANFKDMDSIQALLTAEEKARWTSRPALLRKGQLSLHHPLLIHGSRPNASHAPRRAAVVNYFADGTRSASALPPLHGVPPVPVGERMRGKFFPIVLDPKGFLN